MNLKKIQETKKIQKIKKMKSKLILIAGGTASGKTVIAENVSSSLIASGKTVTYISMDNYYKTYKEIGSKRGTINWDLPSTLRWEKLITDINEIFNHKEIKIKKYNFETCDYEKEEIILKPSDYIIVEGLFALYNEEILLIANLSFFVACDIIRRFKRRMQRDKSKRYLVFNEKRFLNRWEENIEPAYKKYIRPTKYDADIIINNNKDNDPNAEETVKLMLKILK